MPLPSMTLALADIAESPLPTVANGSGAPSQTRAFLVRDLIDSSLRLCPQHLRPGIDKEL